MKKGDSGRGDSRKSVGFVKITGGELRGRKIATPGEGTHPMGERERLALFNMLGDRVAGNGVADLFCGGGTLAIEALSRGATFALMIDSSQTAVDVANQNMKDLGLYGSYGRALLADVTEVVRTATDRFGVVFADPPYDKYDEKMLRHLPRLVLDGGILVVSHPGEAPEFDGMTLVKSRKYAGAGIAIYQKDV